MPMRVAKRYKQLKLSVDSLQGHYDRVYLSFRLNSHYIRGILNGNSVDWVFQSDSPAFVKRIPSGVLYKYALWTDDIPKDIGKVYNGILEAALKVGYDLNEREMEV
jgi:hypothetical protein